VADVTIQDVLAITDAVKARGADQMALQTRNVIKRLFAYAIARGKTHFNPAAAIEARFIATARSRDVALTQPEIGQRQRAIYQSSIRRQHKLALHLLILCMVRKGELIGARWDEIDFDKAEWLIPAERMKKDKPHLVPLSRQAMAMFEAEGLAVSRLGAAEPQHAQGADRPQHAEPGDPLAGPRRARLRDPRLPPDGFHPVARGRLQLLMDRESPRPRAEGRPRRLQ
jgi:site-specific recombinase XerC